MEIKLRADFCFRNYTPLFIIFMYDSFGSLDLLLMKLLILKIVNDLKHYVKCCTLHFVQVQICNKIDLNISTRK